MFQLIFQFRKQLFNSAIISSLLAVVLCYAAFLFYFEQKANPVFGILFLVATAVLLSTVFTTGGFLFVSKVTYVGKISFLQKLILWLLFVVVCYAILFAFDFSLHTIIPELGQSLMNKLDDYKISQNRTANSELLPIGYQGLFYQIQFFPIGFLLGLIINTILLFIRKSHGLWVGK